MVVLDEVGEFMNDNIVNDKHRSFDQPPVEMDIIVLSILSKSRKFNSVKGCCHGKEEYTPTPFARTSRLNDASATSRY